MKKDISELLKGVDSQSYEYVITEFYQPREYNHGIYNLDL